MGIIKLLYGNEPFCVRSELKKIEQMYGQLNTSYTHELSEDLFFQLDQFSLCGEKRAVICMLNRLPDATEFMKKIKRNYCHDLYIVVEELDKRSGIYKSIKSSGKDEVSIVRLDKLDQEHFVMFCAKIIKQKKCQVRQRTLNHLYEHSGYAVEETVTLFDIVTYVKQLCFHAGEGNEVTVQMVETLVPAAKSVVVWHLTDALLAKDNKRLFELSERLLSNGSDAIGLLSLLLAQFRLGYKASLMEGQSVGQIAKSIGVEPFRVKKTLEMGTAELSSAMDILQASVKKIQHGANAKAVFRMTLVQIGGLV